MPAPLAVTNASKPAWRRSAVLALFCATLVICFLRLGAPPVYILNEAREGVYTRAMLDTGDLVLPTVPNHVENGEIIPDKPPLFHWLSAGATFARSVLTHGRLASGAELSREYDEWTLRFPSALCGVLLVMAIALLGAQLIGERAALLAALALLASWQFVVQSHYGRVDMALASCVTISMLLAARALTGGSALVGRALTKRARWEFIAAGAVAGLAVLAKGPLGLVLPTLACGAWTIARTWRERSLRWFPFALAIGAVLACLLVALPWYLCAYREGGDAFLRSQLWNENLQQGAGGNGRMDFFYYLGPWLSDGFPWNLLAVAACVQAWRTRHRGAAFCAIWWASILMFFQLAAYKRGAYLLPALPVSALLAGWWLDQRLPRGASPRLRAALASTMTRLPRWWRIGAAFVALALIAGAFCVRLPALLESIQVVLPAIDGALALGGLAACIVALALCYGAWRRRDGWLAFVAAWIGLVALYLGPLQTITFIPALEKSPKPLVARILADLPEGERVVVRGLGDDPSLILLLAFPDPARIEIVPARAPQPSEFKPGMYLFSRTEWASIGGAPLPEAGSWRELWSDTLRERGNPVPLVFVERLAAKSR